MKLSDLAALCRAVAERCEELAAENERGAEERAQARESARMDCIGQDVDMVISLVGSSPGMTAGEIVAALARNHGLSGLRSRTALDGAKQSGRVIATLDGSKRRHFLPGHEGGE